MGILFSKFKKKESTKDKLIQIQEKIDQLEDYKQCTEQRGKKLVGSLVIYSFIFYLIAAVICYFYYLPSNFNDILFYATPFAAFIILVYLIKRILTWYYHWKVHRNERNLTNLKTKKAEILDQVMETETYKVAKDILETFAPEQLRKTLAIKMPMGTPMSGPRMLNSQGSELRKRITTSTPIASQQGFIVNPAIPNLNHDFARPLQISPKGSTPIVRPNFTSTPRNVVGPPLSYSTATPLNVQYNSYSTGNMDSSGPPGPPMPRPILPRERGILDRFVEYLVGDGPSNRYALVCRQCESHNGMALKEEFPYIAFRCAYCYYWNPARKQKPAPPKLETLSNTLLEKTLQKEEEEAGPASSEAEDEDLASSASGSNSDSPKYSPSEEDSDIEELSGHTSGFHLKKPSIYAGNSQKLATSKTEEIVVPEKEESDVASKSPDLDGFSDSLSNVSTPSSDIQLSSSLKDSNNQEILNLDDPKKEPYSVSEKFETPSDTQT